MTSPRFFIGTTVEGLPCEFAVYYSAGLPERIVGTYFANDTRGEDGHRVLDYFDVPRVEDLPWVVYQGEWEPQEARP